MARNGIGNTSFILQKTLKNKAKHMDWNSCLWCENKIFYAKKQDVFLIVTWRFLCLRPKLDLELKLTEIRSDIKLNQSH